MNILKGQEKLVIGLAILQLHKMGGCDLQWKMSCLGPEVNLEKGTEKIIKHLHTFSLAPS